MTDPIVTSPARAAAAAVDTAAEVIQLNGIDANTKDQLVALQEEVNRMQTKMNHLLQHADEMKLQNDGLHEQLQVTTQQLEEFQATRPIRRMLHDIIVSPPAKTSKNYRRKYK